VLEAAGRSAASPLQVLEAAGRAGSSASEESDVWQVDDVLLEPHRSLVGGRYSPGGSEMTPYERFF